MREAGTKSSNAAPAPKGCNWRATAGFRLIFSPNAIVTAEYSHNGEYGHTPTIPDDVITMRSKVRLKDLVTGQANTYSLVFPTEADFDEGKISILAPIGTAILGYKSGDTIEWSVPSGLRRLKVDEILYQPEAAGDYER